MRGAPTASSSNVESTQPRFVVPAALRDEHPRPVLLLAGVAQHAIAGAPAVRPPLWSLDRAVTLGRDGSGAPGLLAASLADDKLVSRRHVHLEPRADGSWVVRDLGSTNGTRLATRSVDQWLTAGVDHAIEDRTLLGVGGHVFVFRFLRAWEIEALEADVRAPFGPLATLSGGFAGTKRRLRRLARAGAAVLLVGDTGTGKEIFARAVHAAAGRPGPFVALACAAAAENLIDAQAVAGGTLFLDELGDLSPSAQAKLLRLFQDRGPGPNAAGPDDASDVCVVAATSRERDTRGALPGVREDLIARFGPEPVRLPPLRERIEDVGALVSAFGAGVRRRFDVDAHFALYRHPWAGNVRELRKTIEHALAVTDDGETIGFEHLPVAFTMQGRSGVPREVASSPTTVPVERRTPTREELQSLLVRHRGNVAHVARELGRQRTLVWRWLRRHGIRPDRNPAAPPPTLRPGVDAPPSRPPARAPR